MDTPEPNVEGSMNDIDLIIDRRWSLKDHNTEVEFISNNLINNQMEFAGVPGFLSKKIESKANEYLNKEYAKAWLKTHQSPIVKKSQYNYSPSVDKLFFPKKVSTVFDDGLI